MTGECNCGKPGGVHEWWCNSNNEYDSYRCRKCGKPVPQYAMSWCMCPECNSLKE